MPKEKVTLTIEAELLAEFRRLIDARSLSASVEKALEDRVNHLKHMAGLRDLVAELEEIHGPIADEDRAWAKRMFDESDAEIAAKKAAAARNAAAG